MKSAAWCAVLAIAFASTAWGRTPDGDDEKRETKKSAGDDGVKVEALTSELRAQRAELEAQRAELEALKAQKSPALTFEGTGELPQEKKSGDFDLKASFLSDGLFHLSSGDGNFDLHVGGRVLEEYRYIADRPNGPAGGLAAGTARAPADSFYLRELFISVDGTLWKDWGFKMNGDFATDQVGKLEEGFLEWKHFREFRLQMGQYKVPQSYEYMGSPRFLEEIQRTAMTRFDPGIEMGIMAVGDVLDNRIHYWLGVSNGRGHTNNTGRSVVDDNDNKEFQVKLALTPFAPDKDSPLRKFRIGGFYNRDIQGMGQPGSAAPAGAIAAIGNINDYEFNTTWAVMPGNAIGTRQRYGAELMYAYGPFGLRSEYRVRKDHYEDVTGVIDDTLTYKGYYVSVYWILTGEDKTISARPIVAHNFDLAGGWGALELVARYSVTSFDWDTFKKIGGNAGVGISTNRVSEFTAGFNWWTTPNTRIAVEYVGEKYNDPLNFETTGTGKNRSSLGGILARFQIDM